MALILKIEHTPDRFPEVQKAGGILLDATVIRSDRCLAEMNT